MPLGWLKEGFSANTRVIYSQALMASTDALRLTRPACSYPREYFCMRFEDLRLNKPLLEAVHTAGYETPTPIQAQAIPLILDGKDVLGCA